MESKEVKLKFFSNSQEFKEFLVQVYQFVANHFLQYDNKLSHAIDHTLRVANSCYYLANQLDAYLDIVIIAALFHDIGRPTEELTGECHAEVSADIAKKFLEQSNLIKLIPEVSHAILSHRYSKKINAKTKEAKILKDADALDALGAIGLYRTITYSCERKIDLEESLKHFTDKLFKLPLKMHFALTKKIAEEKCDILHKFEVDINKGVKDASFESLLNQI
jgi:uncharacterized protein